MDDPKDFRMVQTRNGVVRVPRKEQGIPLKDFLQNTELPANLDRAVIFTTPSGPVAAAPDPVPWTEAHDKKVQHYAQTIKEQIEDKGYYAKTLDSFAGRLSDTTGYPREEMKAMISAKFADSYGADPFDHLQAIREEKGLPVRTQEPSAEQVPEQD